MKIVPLCSSLLLVFALGKDPVRQPSDLLTPQHINEARRVTFVLSPQEDFRTLFCDSDILRERVAKSTCVIDYAFPTDKVLEIVIPPTATLAEVLQRAGQRRLMAWKGRGYPAIGIIKKHAILRATGKPDYLDTPIEPGDFVIVTPRD
jgi:hypothetical protein